MIIVTADHAKDKDENLKTQAANNPPNNIPRTQYIKTAPVLEVDGSRCMVSLSLSCARVCCSCSLSLFLARARPLCLSLAFVSARTPRLCFLSLSPMRALTLLYALK
jgi:hypothetical protein